MPAPELRQECCLWQRSALVFSVAFCCSVLFPPVASDDLGPGVIRGAAVQPPGCRLDPAVFAPDVVFYVVDCPQVTETAALVLDSPFDLTDAQGMALSSPLQVHLKAGEAKLVAINACNGGSPSSGSRLGCTRYNFDFHRRGSSQAALAWLLVSSGSLDAELTPTFDAAVTQYQVHIPFGATATIEADAAKLGFVSFTSFANAERHRSRHEVSVVAGQSRRVVEIYVVSADRQGQIRYLLVVHQAPNTDAGLASIRSNVGHVRPLKGSAAGQYELQVPIGHRQVAVSATANDRDGAQVTVRGHSGVGYASAVIALHGGAPYEVVHISTRAADGVTTADHVLVVHLEEMEGIAVLSSLVVRDCYGGLQPPFEANVFHYHCQLHSSATQVKVKPSLLWMPANLDTMSLSINGRTWQNGETWVEQVEQSGYAQIMVEVTSQNGKGKATYIVAVDFAGSPTTVPGAPTSAPITSSATTSSESASAVTTTTPAEGPFPSTPAIQTTSTRPTVPPWLIVATTTTVTAATTVTISGGSSGNTSSPSNHHKVSFVLPRPSERAIKGFKRVVNAGLIGSAALALLSVGSLSSGLVLLKNLQFVALTVEVAEPSTLYAHLAGAFDIFNIWVPMSDVRISSSRARAQEVGFDRQTSASAFNCSLGGEATGMWSMLKRQWCCQHEHKGCHHHARRLQPDAVGMSQSMHSTEFESHRLSVAAEAALLKHAGAFVIMSAALPVVVCGLVLGWYFASAEEEMARAYLLPDIGLRGHRAKLLPAALVVLDVGLVGFTSSSAALLFAQATVSVSGGILPPRAPLLMLLVYPLAYVLLGLLQLCRLRRGGRLLWSPLLRLFADARSLAVNLHGPTFNVALENRPASPLLRWVFGSELRSIAPVQAPEGGPLLLSVTAGRAAHTPDGFLFDEQVPERTKEGVELEAGLLLSRPLNVALWQKHQERLGMMLWMDRRCATYAALKQQITDVQKSQRVLNSEGLLIFDSNGDCLVDLYQYCIYQFPSRPWLPVGSCLHSCAGGFVRAVAEYEPVDRSGGVLAAWVPSAPNINSAERQLIDGWLNFWLRETEAVVAARDAVMQLRWRGSDPRTKQDQEAILQEITIALLWGQEMKMPADYSALEAEEREARVTEVLLEYRLNEEPLPWQREVDKLDTHDVQVSLHTGLINSGDFPISAADLQDPQLESAVFGLKRFHLRTAGKILAGEDDDDAGAAAPRPRLTLAECDLPLGSILLMAEWLPTFGFCVPHSALKLPVRERWLPLFATSTIPGAPPGVYLVDAVDRGLAIVAVVLARGLLSLGKPVLAISVLALWRLVMFVCYAASGVMNIEPWQTGIATLLQLLICACLAFSYSSLRQLPSGEVLPSGRFYIDIVDHAVAFAIMGSLFYLGWRGAKVLVRGVTIGSRDPPLHVLSIPEYPDADVPQPPFGEFVAVDSQSDGSSLPLVVAVPSLGLTLQGRACREPTATSDERRTTSWRKRLSVYERPHELKEMRVGDRLHSLHRFRHDVRNCLPVSLTRTQFLGTEEVRELACTIHVVNHVGCSWSSLKHDSFLSLYKPWGLDIQPPSAAIKDNVGITPGVSDTERRERYRQTADSPALVKAWREEVLEWLELEFGAVGGVEHTAEDAMLDAHRGNRDHYKTEANSRVVPGIFSDEGVGSHRYSDSRCFKEGRVLHYVIMSSDLKSSTAWRPDPLTAHPADLLNQEHWQPCLLRLASRSLSYTLRKCDSIARGGSCPEWTEPALQDHGDVVDYTVPFFFLDRLEVDLARNLITVHERDRSATLDEFSTLPDYAPRALPMVFRVSADEAVIWDCIAKRYHMYSRPEHIVNYIGQVCDHPRLPGISCRCGEDGEQLWDDGSRYAGEWQGHVYHGHGQLVDTVGTLIYKGEWQCGLKHGEGVYHFQQDTVRKVYTGEWNRDEFRGQGELWITEECLDDLRRSKPHAVVRYRGFCEVADGQFADPPDLMKLELDKHASLIKSHFPARPTGTRDGPIVQYAGDAPKDFASELYSLDGADLRHCGPDDCCEITYADSGQYSGPCIGGAIPHGAGGDFTEPNGTEYHGAFDNGLRTGPARLVLASGVEYEGQVAQPGGQRHGQGTTTIPDDLVTTFGFKSYEGQYVNGLREGRGKLTFPDGRIYIGGFKANQRHGRGKLEEMAAYYDGPWEHDRPADGKGEIVYHSGHHYIGGFSRALRHGEGKLFNPASKSVDKKSKQLFYEGQWDIDCMHGAGVHRAVDGVYTGQYTRGFRNGEGRFDYAYPKLGAPLPTAPSSKQLAEVMARSRVYDGQWEHDVQHGRGSYSDEYGYTNDQAQCTTGELVSDRRPPAKGFREKWISNPRWPTEDQYETVSLADTPWSSLPRCDWTSRDRLQDCEPTAMRPLDIGSGRSHGRIRAAHLGIEGQPGTRWA